MNRRTAEFNRLYAALPAAVRQFARQSYRLFLADPAHPSLRHHALAASKKGQHLPGSRSVSITMKYRAIYVRQADGTNSWYWIGTHNDYETFIGRK